MIFGESALLQQLAARAINQNDGNGCMIKPAHMGCMFAQSADWLVLRI
jgi:hypothetical protein